MLVRDDEDLAIDQLAAAGRADDPQLTRPAVEPPQEQAAERAEPLIAGTGPAGLRDLRGQLEGLRAQLQSLPVGELGRFDELDARARTLSEARDRLRGELDRLPAPRARRIGRSEDPNLVEHTRLSSALTGTQDQLEHALAQRATLARELGDPAAIRDERDGLTNAISTLEREHTQLRDHLAERELATEPAWTRETLGERPRRGWDAERWDRAARTIARYRIEYEITDTDNPLGQRPDSREQRVDYERAERARHQLARELGHDTSGHEIDLG
jgi:chromosome segregation ATPase